MGFISSIRHCRLHLSFSLFSVFFILFRLRLAYLFYHVLSHSIVVVSKYALSRAPSFAILCWFLCRLTCGNRLPTRMRCVSHICGKAIKRWTFVIVTMYYVILTLWCGSSFRCPAVDVACLCCVASVQNFIGPSLTVMKILNLKRIWRRFCIVLMGRRNQNSVLCWLFSVFHLDICI